MGISSDPDRMVGMSSELIIGASEMGVGPAVGADVGVSPPTMAHTTASKSMQAVVGKSGLFGSTKARNSHSRLVVDKSSTELSAPKLLNEDVSESSSAYTFTNAFPIALLLIKQHESMINTPGPIFSMITP